MIKSFRLRLALFSALLTGLALVAFGLGSWWLIRDIKIERIDNEVRTYAEREVGRIHNAGDWSDTEQRLVSALGIRDSSDLLFLFQDNSGATVYRSPHWPVGLDVAHLGWPQQQLSQGNGGDSFSLIDEARAADDASGWPLLIAQADPRFGRPPPGGRFGRDGRPPRLDMPPREGVNGEPLPPPSSDTQFAVPPTTPLENTVPQAAPELAPSPTVRDDGSAPGAVPPPLPLPERQDIAPADPPPLPGPPPISTAVSQSVDGQLWRIGLASTDRARVAVAVNARVIDADMKGTRNAFLVALPLSLILIGFGSWVFSNRAMRPLKKLAATTRLVTAEGLNQRISGKGEDHEFVELIEVYNRMLERLERSFKQAHRFSADAAHELKTPLAILQGQLERAIGAAEDGSPMQTELTSILDEVRRLSTISRKLLLLSQADAGRLSVHREPFDLSGALADLIEDTQMLAPLLRVNGKIHPGLNISADGSLLRQVLHNLISNAIKYNVEQGWIDISTTVWPQRVEVQVANSSRGIPAADCGKIFERFYRSDPAHGRHIEGVGLGLSVSREIARAHGGDITLKAESDGTVRFSLLLPYSFPNVERQAK